MKKSIFFIICVLFTYSVNSQNLEKLLDEAKKVVYDDSCLFLKDFGASLPAKDAGTKIPTTKISIILNKNTQYCIYLFKSDALGQVELGVENKDVAGKVPTIIVPSGKTYSSMDFETKVTGVHHLYFKNLSDKHQDLIGIISLPKNKKVYKKLFQSVNDYINDSVCNMADEMPQFIKGDDMAFAKWIMQNLKYPEKAKKNGIQGKAYAQFIVDKLGKMRDIKIIRSIDPEIDEAIINTLKTAPLWQKPGKNKGKNVNVMMTMPVKLALTK